MSGLMPAGRFVAPFRVLLVAAVLSMLAGCSWQRASMQPVVRNAPEASPAAGEMPKASAPAQTANTSVKAPEYFGDESQVVPASLDEPDSHVTVATPPEPTGVPLNLVSALSATDAKNPQVEFARWRVQEAYAQAQRADVLWLPNLRAGIAYNRHEGAIQDVAGNVFDTSRGGYYYGLGPHAVGQGSPSVPGIQLNVHAADVIFQPKIANSVSQARSWNAKTATCDEMFETAQLYLELMRAQQDVEIGREQLALTQLLVDLTGAYARSGQGLESDFDRAKTELAVRETDLLRAQETVEVASARLAVQLRLDPSVPILVQEPVVVPVQLVGKEHAVADLVVEGLSRRPELAESGWLVCEATERLQREKYAPLLPSVLLGMSYGGLGGGLGTNFGTTKDRFDSDAIAYWELRNFGAGERAARREANARIEQARWRQVAMLDRVAGEVVEAHSRIRSREKQIVSAEKAVASAGNSYHRNLTRIKNAEGLPIETLQAIQALGFAKRDYLRAVTDYNVAQFQLLRAVGGGSSQFLAASFVAKAEVEAAN